MLTTTSGTQIGGGLVANNAQLLDTAGGGYVAVEMAFIQFAGFTFGKSASVFATPWHGYPGNNNSFLMGGHDTVTGVNNIQYTAELGNGVSLSVGLDDPTVFHRTAVYNLSVPLNTNISVQPDGTAATAFLGARVRLRTSTAACMLRPLWADCVSTRLGVCSRFRPRRTKSTALTTPWPLRSPGGEPRWCHLVRSV